MPKVADDAVQAARAGIERALALPGTGHVTGPPDIEEILARAALEAAAPAMAEHAARAVLAHRDAHGPADGASRRRWRRILGIAAQVVSLAFSTEEDIKRMAAKALAEGNCSACDAEGPVRDHGTA